MSPTSYQAAPPRNKVLSQAESCDMPRRPLGVKDCLQIKNYGADCQSTRTAVKAT